MISQDGQNLSDKVMHPDKEVLFFGRSLHLKVDPVVATQRSWTCGFT